LEERKELLSLSSLFHKEGISNIMIEMWKRIGDHLTRFRLANHEVERYMKMTIGESSWITYDVMAPDSKVTVHNGYGSAFDGQDPVALSQDEQGLTFTRSDFLLTLSADYREAEIRFYDYFGLRTALLNWYSTIITHRSWGVIIHSSCIVQNGEAHLFAGLSGAGKSTVASLSRPRQLLADETSLVKVTANGQVVVHDSPFRNDFKDPAGDSPIPLRAIYLLKQSPVIRKHQLRSSDALLALFNKIVHWQHDVKESMRLVQMCRKLVVNVPVYELEFQKNDLFWEAIS
jgi:hypothetical protein